MILMLIKIVFHYLGCSQETPPPPPLSENAKGFLATLEHSSEEELTLHLQDRMQFSKEAVACLVCAFDRLHSHINCMSKQVQATGMRRNTPVTVILTFCKLLKKKDVHKETKPLRCFIFFILKSFYLCLIRFHQATCFEKCDINHAFC